MFQREEDGMNSVVKRNKYNSEIDCLVKDRFVRISDKVNEQMPESDLLKIN